MEAEEDVTTHQHGASLLSSEVRFFHLKWEKFATPGLLATWEEKSIVVSAGNRRGHQEDGRR
jgi:hypothetical protein